ncbi:MAG TPA: glycosyltransferase [Solirubrobacteraceae bacterium]|nr:glycosyltransferase [Solirubrobacteraceae bacterium]
MQPQITIVVPVWDDYVRYLDACVASLRDQDPRPQVLVVDNASQAPVPELTGTTVLRLTERLPVGDARNAALERVGTDYVMFCDADDELAEGGLRALYDALAGDLSLGFAGGRIARLRDDGGAAEPIDWPPSYVLRLARYPRLLAMRSLWLSSLPATCTLYRTEVARAAGGFGEGQLGEDWSFVTAVAFRARGVLLDRPVRRYRMSEDSLFHRARSLTARRRAHRAVRRRMLRDPAVPLYVKALMPIFALHHWQFLRREPE